ncbi:hypothetical protein [Segetibacter sp.]|jgi:hypothetical protein|uniref:hypothetical protein n=1 Tax=Segetibacter sp. TaxID=2231182 RepID=UPI00260E165A|nr:hypothetical protein [Segetibacter sp.]MCW3079696.1 hypothetical protein [Segetibacter sp.]
MKKFLVVFFLVQMAVWKTTSAQINDVAVKGKNFYNISLESSLKPFKKNDKEYIRKVAAEMFLQWQSLLRHTDTVSIMLWTADGSEILDYSGSLNQPLEWAKYMGNPNTNHEVGSGPKELSLHERAYEYLENPPKFTYEDLKFIVQTLKETGSKMTGKVIRVGATFDPGPEFAKSDFKYKRHREILGGNAMGEKSFVSCYSVLNADTHKYAGYPTGIPANTHFGTFFGRQSEHFLKDLGYDYIWFSNGFGFGVEGWNSTGAIFTGTDFIKNKMSETRLLIADFWKLYRKECPSYEIQTRGTNLSAGIDLARDGVDLKNIYGGNFNILPPPNSPWAALDGDFGLEMVGYMSRISEIPDNRYLFRYYTHDPWWVNSPWLDRYGSEPHDIYLPMSVSRINDRGEITPPTHLNFLTIDNTYGDMPAQVPDEVIPHILKARYNLPTQPGPLVWVYPFDEYHNWAYTQQERLPEIYYGDWLIRQAINNGFPLNTITSTKSFQTSLNNKPGLYNESILLCIVPDAGSAFEKQLINFVQNGGKLIVYGPADHIGAGFASLLNLQNVEPLEGEFQLNSTFSNDILEKKYPARIFHRSLFSGGGVRTKVKEQADKSTKILSTMLQNTKARDVVWVRTKPEWKGGKVGYVRGTNSSRFTGGKLLAPDDPEKWFAGGMYLRYILKEFGIEYNIDKQDPSVKNPVLTVSRSNNAFYFSGYVPNTTVKQRFKFPQGAPILNGFQTKFEKGFSTYSLPTAWNRECRIFIEQNDGIVSCKDIYSGDKDIRRRLEIDGLNNATVRIYPEDNITAEQLKVYLNSTYPWKTGSISFKAGDKKYGNHYVIEKVTGRVSVAW